MELEPMDCSVGLQEGDRHGRTRLDMVCTVKTRRARKLYSIARAIVLNPKYLFCDEPNSGLDPKTAIVIDQLLQEITQEFEMTTVINTHDMNSVIEIGDHIIFIKDGKKAWQGTGEEILSTDNTEIVDFVYSSELFKKIRRKL